MMKNIALFLTIGSLLPLLFLSSCETFDAKVEVPAYVKIDSVTFKCRPDEGTSKQNITDVWFNLNGSRVGAFELPAKFPVIAHGVHPVSIRGGIMKSGVSDFREVYPFFDVVKIDTLDFVGAEALTLIPEFEYKEEAQFWIEDFEDPGIKFHSNDTNKYLNQIIDPDNSENHIGHVYLPDTTKAFQIYTKHEMKMSTTPIYLEIEYKCDKDFAIGIVTREANGSSTAQEPFTYIKPKETWNKLYLNLSEQFLVNPGAASYDIYMFFITDNVNPSNVYMDNIKIVSF